MIFFGVRFESSDPSTHQPISHSAPAPGLTELKWSHGAEQIPEFIAGAMKVVSDVSAIVDIMKAPAPHWIPLDKSIGTLYGEYSYS